jgi:hypothetical protein
MICFSWIQVQTTEKPAARVGSPTPTWQPLPGVSQGLRDGWNYLSSH